MKARVTVSRVAVILAGVLTYSVLDASEKETKPMKCEISGTASLTTDYGNLSLGDVLEVSLSLNLSGEMYVSLPDPVIESGTMSVTDPNGGSLKSSVVQVNTWDRKTSKTSFMTRIFGPYLEGDVGGISGPAPTKPGHGWRPGIEFFGEAAGTVLDGRFPVSAEDWDLLPRRTLTLPDPNRVNSIMPVALFDEMTVQCELTSSASK